GWSWFGSLRCPCVAARCAGPGIPKWKVSTSMTTDNLKTLRLDEIRIDGGTQPHVAIDQSIVDEYAQQYSAGVDLTPVTVFYDGANYWLADGFHRYWANRKIKSDYIFAHVRQGTQRDAILY